MSSLLEKRDNIPPEKRKKLLEAKKSFQKMFEEIAPFIKRREFEMDSTEGDMV